MNNKKSTGHTVSFLFWGVILMVAMYAVGSLLNPGNLAYQASDFLAVLVALFAWILLGGLLNFLWFTGVFHLSLGSVYAGMKKTDHMASEGYENISRAFVAGGWYLVAAQILAFSSAPSLRVFLANCLTHGAIALLASAIVVALISIFGLGVYSIEGLKGWFDNPRNNQIVFMVMALINGAVLIAMNVRI